MNEIYKDIVGYEGLYQISNLGNVKSLARIDNCNRCRKEVIMSPGKSHKGYLRIALCKNGIKQSYSINRLIAELFIPNPNNKPQTNHLNGIKTDNRVENIEWCNNSENQLHAIKNGLKPSSKGECNGNHKITKEQVIEIRNKYVPIKYSAYKLAKEYGVRPGTIQFIIKYKTWKEVKG
jgi:hypothetical protein